MGRSGAAVLAACGSGELAAALTKHLETGSNREEVERVLASLEGEEGRKALEAEALRAKRLAALKARLEALMVRKKRGSSHDLSFQKGS